jgi:hypothetical protein
MHNLLGVQVFLHAINGPELLRRDLTIDSSLGFDNADFQKLRIRNYDRRVATCFHAVPEWCIGGYTHVPSRRSFTRSSVGASSVRKCPSSCRVSAIDLNSQTSGFFASEAL